MDATTLPRHELAGLHARVAGASNPALVGLAGEVVDETTNTLLVRARPRSRAGSGAVKRVPKAAATFEFRLPDGGDAADYVTVDGERLVARPARRTETTGDDRWR